MNDAGLLARFEAQQLAQDEWHHRTHLRVAWNYLRANDFGTALGKMREGIKRLNDSHGLVDQLADGYHETLTEAWLRLVADAMRRQGAADSSEEFLDAQTYLDARTLMRLFYSKEQLVTAEAKISFVPADLRPLPEWVDANR